MLSNRENRQKYWQDRAERTVLAGEKTALEMTTDLKKAYTRAEKQITKEIESFYSKYAKETGLDITEIRKRLNPKELQSVKDDIAEFLKEAKNKDYKFDPMYKKQLEELSSRAYISRLEELKLNINHEVEKLYSTQQTAFKNSLEETYKDSYMRTIFNVQQGTGVASNFTSLNTRVIEKAVSTKWLGDGKTYSDRIWNHKDNLVRALETQMVQGFILGQNPKVIAKNLVGLGLQDKTTPLKTQYKNAVRLARTEHSYITNSATFDAYKETSFIHSYQYLAILDNKTSELCISFDNQIIPLKEKVLGVNYPPLHPNCRSTTIPYFEPDEIDEMFNHPEKSNYVLPNLSYEQWKDELKDEPDELAGVKRGKPMTFEEANHGKSNPQYGKVRGYDMNCQTCVVSYEARLRGYNTESKAYTKGSVLETLSRASHTAWIDPTTGETPDRKSLFTEGATTPKKLLQYLKDNTEENARYTFAFGWKGNSRSGHIISLEKIDGSLRLYDPQIGRTYEGVDVGMYLNRLKYTTTSYGQKFYTPARLLRVDNKEFNKKIVNEILKGVGE
jgi:SPP1 gp7 family putative phage head morphogenesis protein